MSDTKAITAAPVVTMAQVKAAKIALEATLRDAVAKFEASFPMCRVSLVSCNHLGGVDYTNGVSVDLTIDWTK